MTDPISAAPEEAIRECPFCGGEPDVACNGPSVEQMQHARAWGEDYDVSYYVQCLSCAATSTEAAERCAAIAAWNRRAGGEREAWQPIESAPHGVDVLLFSPADTWGNTTIEVGQASWGWRNSVANNMSYHSYATHWQQLPAPPCAALAGHTEGERNGG